MKKLAVDMEIDDIVKFLRYRKDIADLCQASDVYVSVGLQKGLPVSVIEAMSCGLPIVASDIREHRDAVMDGENEFLFVLGDAKRMCDGILNIYKTIEPHVCFSKESVALAKKYDLKSIRLKMAKIYDEVGSRFS